MNCYNSRSHFPKEIITDLCVREDEKYLSNDKNLNYVYNLLCYDEPQIDSAGGVNYEKLAYYLVDSHFCSSSKVKFRLWNILLKGLDEIMIRSKINKDMYSSLAELCFSIYIKCPLSCLSRSDELESIRSVLRSYSGLMLKFNSDELFTKENEEVLQEDIYKVDDLKEKFAEESDPDDYEYESFNDYQSTNTEEIIDSVLLFDPEEISPQYQLQEGDVCDWVLSLVKKIDCKSLTLDLISTNR